jgi:chloride channel protein, CIC family
MLGIGVMYFGGALERLFNRLPLPIWIKPAIGGLCIGAMAIVTPQVLAAGHGAMVTDIARTMSASLILTIILLKLSASLVSLASGFRGGLFFASLFVGCLLGKLCAMLFPMLAGGLALDPTTGMLTGMASLAVAIVGGPLTMSFLVLETTRNLEVTAGVLAACLVANVFVRTAFGHSFSTWRLHLRGETITSASDVGWLRSLTVAGMMQTDIATVDGSTSIAECRRNFPLGSRSVIFVVDAAGGYRGFVAVIELFSAEHHSAAGEKAVSQLARFPDRFLLPSMNIKAAMAHFSQAGTEVLAVLESPACPRIIGMLSESHTTRRYVEELGRATRGVVDLN